MASMLKTRMRDGHPNYYVLSVIAANQRTGPIPNELIIMSIVTKILFKMPNI